MRIQLIHDIYWCIHTKYTILLSHIAPVYLSKIQYKKAFNRQLNLDNPEYLNEKLMWLKFNRYTNNALVTKCIDKYSVREYVSNCGLDSILNELLGVWDNVNDIDWDSLPDRFVLKCNHACSYNVICTDKQKLDIEKTKIKLNKWMHSETWTLHAETNYKGIPHKIVAEKYLDGIGGALPVDYKIYCFNGKPMYIGNFIERDIDNDKIIRGYFNLDWTPANIFDGYTSMEINKFPKPSKLDEMLECARILSKPFPFVRVDLYEVNGRIFFGELTFTPTGCMGAYYTKEASLRLGHALDITKDVKQE